jgi:putative SOS response-associated peptidase YedK
VARLFTAQAGSQQIADQFGVENAPIFSIPSEMSEGDEGPVVFENGGRRLMKMMRWGFPRRDLRAAIQGDEPGIIGLVADLTNPMWDTLVVDQRYRCLIPLTHFANPAGEAGSKTRSWFSVKDEPIVAWAGFCRNLPDVGSVFAGLTTEASAVIQPYNDRMPVLLSKDEYERWLNGSIGEVIEFQFRPPMRSDRIAVLNTNDRWRTGGVPDFLARRQAALL